MANISRQRFDSLFTQTVWKYSNMRVVESDATLAKEPLKMIGLIINPETFTCRNGKVYLRNFDDATGKYTITERAFYYNEKINRLTFIGTDVSWEIIRLTPHAPRHRIPTTRRRPLEPLRLVLLPPQPRKGIEGRLISRPLFASPNAPSAWSKHECFRTKLRT